MFLIAHKCKAGLAIRGGTPPRGQQVKALFVLNCQPKLRSQIQSLRLTPYRLLRDQDTTRRDAAGFVQPERAARPADREERAAAAATGSIHVLRHHPASGMHAPATGSATTLPIWTGAVKRSPTYFSCRGQADNWSHASRNVWGKQLVWNSEWDTVYDEL